MTYPCSHCEREFETQRGLIIHLRFYDPDKGCAVPAWPPRISVEESMERLSDRNVLRACNGNTKKLTARQKNTLMKRGLAVRVKKGGKDVGWGGAWLKLTPKGRAVLREVRKSGGCRT